jgi:hypothetical protein
MACPQTADERTASNMEVFQFGVWETANNSSYKLTHVTFHLTLSTLQKGAGDISHQLTDMQHTLQIWCALHAEILLDLVCQVSQLQLAADVRKKIISLQSPEF